MNSELENLAWNNIIPVVATHLKRYLLLSLSTTVIELWCLSKNQGLEGLASYYYLNYYILCGYEPINSIRYYKQESRRGMRPC